MNSIKIYLEGERREIHRYTKGTQTSKSPSSLEQTAIKELREYRVCRCYIRYESNRLCGECGNGEREREKNSSSIYYTHTDSQTDTQGYEREEDWMDKKKTE